ncbi:hypothetical protein niasHT_016968 [Heterodera trifolii]|uniref:RRM domain-containing protein n=1 Tax=Heterodera trifolii TaxID=157864 RepID=A0ABD2LBY1_9BILA
MFNNAYGSYGGGPGAYSSAYGALSSSISFETNSKDPFLQRARVFVGNIMTSKVGREEIIQLFSNYGKLLGVTVFKGYAFVQFSYGTEADLSVSALNGYNWHGGTLDVKLAMHGQQPTPGVPPPAPAPKSIFGAFPIGAPPKSIGKRNKLEQPQQEAAAKDLKRMKIDTATGGTGAGAAAPAGSVTESVPKNGANKAFAAQMDSAGIGTVVPPHANAEILDTLICGGCRFVTHSLAEFVEHRKRPCKLPSKIANEPDVLGCISCDEKFESSWALLSHHNTAHIRPLFKAIDSISSASIGTGGSGGGGTIANGGGDQQQQQQQHSDSSCGGGAGVGDGSTIKTDMDESMTPMAVSNSNNNMATNMGNEKQQQKTEMDLSKHMPMMNGAAVADSSNGAGIFGSELRKKFAELAVQRIDTDGSGFGINNAAKGSLAATALWVKQVHEHNQALSQKKKELLDHNANGTAAVRMKPRPKIEPLTEQRIQELAQQMLQMETSDPNTDTAQRTYGRDFVYLIRTVTMALKTVNCPRSEEELVELGLSRYGDGT